MRIGPCLAKSVHFREAAGHSIGMSFFSSLFLDRQKKGLARVLENNYEAMKAYACEILSSQKILLIQKGENLFLNIRFINNRLMHNRLLKQFMNHRRNLDACSLRNRIQCIDIMRIDMPG